MALSRFLEGIGVVKGAPLHGGIRRSPRISAQRGGHAAAG
jgi:hypothetical protein